MTRYSPRTGLPTEYQVGPFSAQHYYVQWGGSLPGGDEWSCGVRMLPDVPGPPPNDPALLTGAAAAVQAWHNNGMISPRALLKFTKVNLVGINGRYVADSTFEHVHPNVPGSGPEARTLPNQVAMAVSLVTGVSRGPAHRGRFYMPLPTVLTQTDGRVTEGDADAVRAAGQTFVAAMNAAHAGWSMAVFSRKAGRAAHRFVTGVEVGMVLDTQRRRRNKLAENYQ